MIKYWRDDADPGPRGFLFSQILVMVGEDMKPLTINPKLLASMQFPARYQVSMLLCWDRNCAMRMAPAGPIRLLPRRKWRTKGLVSRLVMSESMCGGPTTLDDC